MVKGMEVFRDKFRGFEDCYTVIGGAACDILMAEADMPFRATKDIDMILILEDRFPEFAAKFWEFIRDGGYKCGWKNSRDIHFYRFTEPLEGYPVQIELFSREPGYSLDSMEGIVPIHVTDEVSSLSAILLNDDFYYFMLEGRRSINGISVLDTAYLIPFKMFAWIDLSDRKRSGEHVNERDLKKHKYDVFRLLEIVTADQKIPVSGFVRECIQTFVEKIRDEELALRQIGLSISKEEGMALIREMY